MKLRMRLKTTGRALFNVALMLMLAISTFAHDYWLEPEAFFVAPGERVSVRLHLGEALASEEESAFQRARIVRFQMVSAGGTQDLLAAGSEGQTPFAHVTFPEEGTHLIALDRNASTITLVARRFNAYLREEGLGSVITLRRRTGQMNRPGRERYSRFLKTIVQVGTRRDDSYGHVLGQRLEIVPQSNPSAANIGDRLAVRVLIEGRPLGGAQVTAYNRAASGNIERQTVTTSADGVATFTLNRSGQWLIRLVHMRRCAENCRGVDWESFWAALSFGMRPAPASD